jgi:uncharacterized protein
MKHKIALITGATSGIGAAFARKLAAQKYDLIILGRREALIKALAKDLQKTYHVKVEVMIAELADYTALQKVVKKIKATKNLELLINNAGFGHVGAFGESDLTTNENMIKVHTTAILNLTYAALPNMLKNKCGAIINVSSVLAVMPRPQSVVYTASKAFINMFTRSLDLELQNSGVKVQALCPGLTATDFFSKLGLTEVETKQSKPPLVEFMSPEKVVEQSLHDLARNKVISVPGFLNKFAFFMVDYIPHGIMRRAYRKVRKDYKF